MGLRSQIISLFCSRAVVRVNEIGQRKPTRARRARAGHILLNLKSLPRITMTKAALSGQNRVNYRAIPPEHLLHTWRQANFRHRLLVFPQKLSVKSGREPMANTYTHTSIQAHQHTSTPAHACIHSCRCGYSKTHNRQASPLKNS